MTRRRIFSFFACIGCAIAFAAATAPQVVGKSPRLSLRGPFEAPALFARAPAEMPFRH